MTDWWNTEPVRREGETDGQEWHAQAERDMERIARSGEDLSRDPDDWGHGPQGEAVDLRQTRQDEQPEPQQKPDRRKALIAGAAGAAVAGILVFAVMPEGSAGGTPGPAASPVSTQEGFLPAAGSGPSEAARDRSEDPAIKAPKLVTVTAAPSGTGSVGAIVELTIHNGTDEVVVVMSSMVKGDGRPAVIGEGTLAPGSRKIEPGETVSGTVEFAAKKEPLQILLMGLDGSVVAGT